MTLLVGRMWEMCHIFSYRLDHNNQIEFFKRKCNIILMCKNFGTKFLKQYSIGNLIPWIEAHLILMYVLINNI